LAARGDIEGAQSQLRVGRESVRQTLEHEEEAKVPKNKEQEAQQDEGEEVLKEEKKIEDTVEEESSNKENNFNEEENEEPVKANDKDIPSPERMKTVLIKLSKREVKKSKEVKKQKVPKLQLNDTRHCECLII
jgi:hypothetical protein